MAPRGNTRRRTLARNGRRPQRLGRMIHRNVKGVQITPPADPPSYVSAPWWPFTLAIKVKNDTQLYAQNLYTEVLKTLGLATFYNDAKATIPLEYRVLSIRAWSLKKETPIQLAVYDHLGTKERICEINDFGTPIRYARVGWKFGSIGTNDALVPVADLSKDYVIAEISLPSEGTALVYVQLLLRVPNASKPITVWSDLVHDYYLVNMVEGVNMAE